MIALKRLNNTPFILNAEMIESVEATPDSVITLVTGKKMVVKNGIEDIVRKTVKYKQLISQSIQVVHRKENEILE